VPVTASNDESESESGQSVDPIHSSLTSLRSKFCKNLFIAHVNINSIRNKFDYIDSILSAGLVDFISISETKLDSSFTNSQFSCSGFNLHRNDSTHRSGGLMAYVRNDIPHRRRTDLESNGLKIQLLILECIIRKHKWLIITCYKLPSIKHEHFVECMDKVCTNAMNESNDIIIMGDFNVNMMIDNVITQQICDVYGLKNVITDPTCYKSKEGTLIDPVLVTNKNRIITSFNIKCGASDWHNIVGCVTKLHMQKQENTRIMYRSYKNFID